MRFYSGFSLKHEEFLFKSFLNTSEYCVCGFSYGAIKAFEDVKKSLACGNRVDTLQLFSPAFFQTKSEKFKKLQTLAYTRNKEKYLEQFRTSCFFPHAKIDVEFSQNSIDELEELLQYEWLVDSFDVLISKGVKIEVYLGSEDQIIDVEGARDFFKQIASLTYIKNANHFLQTQ